MRGGGVARGGVGAAAGSGGAAGGEPARHEIALTCEGVANQQIILTQWSWQQFSEIWIVLSILIGTNTNQ